MKRGHSVIAFEISFTQNLFLNVYKRMAQRTFRKVVYLKTSQENLFKERESFWNREIPFIRKEGSGSGNRTRGV